MARSVKDRHVLARQFSFDVIEPGFVPLCAFDNHRFRPELSCGETHHETRQWLLNCFHATNYVVVGKYLPFDSVNLCFAPAARPAR